MAPWTVAHQAPLSIEFPKQEYWGELSFPSPRNIPNPGIEPRSPALQAESLLSEPLVHLLYIKNLKNGYESVKSGKPRKSGYFTSVFQMSVEWL